MSNDVRYMGVAASMTNKEPRRVFFTGTGALKKGQGLCFDRNYGTAATADARRDQYVELPSTSNNLWFAGVTAEAYTADANGQWISIYEPDSVCELSLACDTTVAATVLTCLVGSAHGGRFVAGGIVGRGSALALQTQASGVLTESLDGAAAIDATGLIITDAGATFLTDGVEADDEVLVLTGEDDATSIIAAGSYTIASVDSETQITIDEICVDTAGGTPNLAFVIITGDSEPRCLAYLYDGIESGLAEWITPVSASVTDCMDAGMTFIMGGITLGTDSTATATSTNVPIGCYKAFKEYGALTTQDYLVTAAGVKGDAATAMTTLEFDANGDTAFMQRTPGGWALIEALGPTLA